MIPETTLALDEVEISEETQPSLTYALDIENNRIRGKTDDLDAIKQAVFLILAVERFEHLIYSFDYGTERKELIGKSKDYVMSEVKRLITEALTEDDRIDSVDSFKFEQEKKSLHVNFVCNTIYGDLESEVTIDV